MPKLSLPLHQLKPRYDVVVVGSGYGGGIAASRFARAGRRVCVLERGREYQSGDFPASQWQAARSFQFDSPAVRFGTQAELFDFRFNPDIHVLVGSGLGGTSLINANVSLKAERWVLDDPVWPAAIREDRDQRLEEGYARALEMLRPAPYPADFPRLAKLEALAKAAEFMGEKDRFYRPPINVTFADGVNHVGVEQRQCILCGDCVSGCNHKAKNTVAMNYLPDARNHGAEIFTETPVSHLERLGEDWLVCFQWIGHGRETFQAPELFVRAGLVVLAAGSLGSTEILLRSQAKGVRLSDRLGERFSGNGDVLGFAYNCDVPIDGMGWGRRKLAGKKPVGPCITGIIDLRERQNRAEGSVLEEGAIPGGLAGLAPYFFPAASGALGRDTDRGVLDYLQEKGRSLRSLLLGPFQGAARNTLTLLLMSHDDAAGRLRLENGRVRVAWERVGQQSVFRKDNAHMKQVARALGGTFLQNPLWSKLTDHSVITVHPLGGCPMAEDAARGVVNHKGQVFSGAQGDAVYANLLVCDGAVVPRALGVNPLLTISALAERSCRLVAEENGWRVDYALPPVAPRAEPRSAAGLQFTETMTGHFSTSVLDDFDRAAAQARESGSTFAFTLTATVEDLRDTLEDPEHRAALVGTVTAPALSSSPLVATEGEFRLLTETPQQADTLWMHYTLKLASREGRLFYFQGFKRVHDDVGPDLWADTTTLYITVREGSSPEGPVIGKGILRIPLRLFLRQMLTFRILHEKRWLHRSLAALRFYAFFAGRLLQVFGGPLRRFVRRSRARDPSPPPQV